MKENLIEIGEMLLNIIQYFQKSTFFIDRDYLQTQEYISVFNNARMIKPKIIYEENWYQWREADRREINTRVLEN